MASPEDLFASFRRRADAPALAAVFDAVAPELLLVASHLATAPTAAEDLVQATFLDAIEKADRWDASRPLMPWLIGILVNHARLERRRQQRPLDAARLPQPEEPSPLDALAASEVAEQVAAALRSLPRQFRQTLTLRLVHGLTPTEIAHALGCPVATVKTRLQRGMDWLRKLLPSGIAVGLAGMVSAGRGLAAVRTAVLAHKTLVPVAATATGVAVGVAGVVGGGVVMKKLVLAACVVVCVAALWFTVPRPDEPVLAGAGTPEPGSSQAAALGIAKEPAANGKAPEERVAAPAVAAATTGSAELEFVWKELGTPCSCLYVSCDPASDDRSDRFSRQTDGEGRLRLADLRSGDYRLFGFFPRMHQLTIRAGEVTTERIEVDPVLRVDGTVVDADGRGVPGAAVFVQYFADSSDVEPRPLAVSRADGTFAGATDRGGYFWAQKPGFVPSVCRLEHVEGRLKLRLVLGGPATGLSGTVRAADRGPAANARVTIVRTKPRDQCGAPIVLRTDANGAFATSELGAGEHLLVAQAPAHAKTPIEFTVVAGRTQSLDVQLLRGAVVFGSVRGPGGRPLSAEVCAYPAWAASPAAGFESLRPLYLLCVVRTQVGADGSYRLEHVPGTAVMVETSAYAAVDEKRDLQLQDGGEQRCDFELGGGGKIHGRVVDADERPQADWTVTCVPVHGGRGDVVSTDAQGRFSADSFDGSEYVLTAMPRSFGGHLPWATAANVRPGAGEVVLRTRYGTDDAGWFTGTVLDANGAAPERPFSAWLTPVAQVQGAQCQVTMRDGGRFELGPVPPGRYHVLVRLHDQGAIQLGAHELPPRGKVDLGSARLPAPGILELRFTTADGRDVVPTELSAWDKSGNGGAMFERSADGVFRSQPVPAGVYRVYAWGEDFARLDQPAVVTAERATLTALQVVAATPVRFTVQPGAGSASGTVQLQVQDGAGKVIAAPTLTVDATTGCVWSRGLPRGSYSFEAKAWPDGEPVRGTFVVSGESGVQRVEVKLPPGR